MALIEQLQTHTHTLRFNSVAFSGSFLWNALSDRVKIYENVALSRVAVI